MPAITSIPDVVNLTRTTFEKNKWDSVGLAQLYPGYEIVQQGVRARRMVRDMSFKIESALEVDSPSTFQQTQPATPIVTNRPKLALNITTPLVLFENHFTWSEHEKSLQGKSDTKLIDTFQMLFTKNQRDHLEGMENLLLSSDFETSTVDKFRSVRYWVTNGAAVTRYAANGGDDPVASGAAGVTKAAQPLWPNAVGVFDNVSQDDFFDLISKFLNTVKTEAVVPHPQVAPEAPARVLYVQDPVKRAVERVLSASNENLGDDAGFYRNASMYRGIPITIWHALASPQSPVRNETGVGEAFLIDWNSFMFQIHSEWDMRVINGDVANTPAQHYEAYYTWLNIHCTRRDRNLYLRTSTTELLPDAV